MRPSLIIVIALALVVAGGIALYFALAQPHTGLLLVSALLILSGAVGVFIGVSRYMNTFMTSQHAPESDYGKTEVRLLVQAMGAMAAADGQIADQEVETMAHIYERMLGIRISAAEVREILAEFSPGFDIAGRLADSRAELSPEIRRLIVQCCHLVILSDRVEKRTETDKLHGVASALGFGEEDVADLLASAGV